MPPDAEQTTGEAVTFTNSFWSKDRTGVDNLLNYIQSKHDELLMLHGIYLQRCKLEREFGEKLQAMAKESVIQERQKLKAASKNKDEGEEDQKDENRQLSGVSAVFETVSLELHHTAQSHLKLAAKLEEGVASGFEDKLNEYRELLDKWSTTLDEIYSERQEKISELIKIRTKYLKEHELSKGTVTPMMEKLKDQYKDMVTVVDDIAQEWNALWKEACEVMEAMEEDRVELLRTNLWEYANLTSASLLVQDEWCERIRQKLEICNVEDEIEKCVTLYATGSKVPSTNDYVGEMMRAYKRKQQTRDESSPAPMPPAKPTRQKEKPERASQSIDAPRKKSDTTQENKEPDRRKEPRRESEAKPTETKPSAREKNAQTGSTNSTIQRSISVNSASTDGIGTISSIMSKAGSNNMGSTATRGQVKRKPLNKSLMEQVSNEMAKARQQRERIQESEASSPTSPISGVVGQKKVEMTGSLDNLLKSFETNETASKGKPSPSPQQPAEAPVSEEAKNRRQPSEYKPDSGSLPSKRNSNNRASEEETDAIDSAESTTRRSDSLEQATAMSAMNAPKSPRPTAQQIPPVASESDLGTKQTIHSQPYNTQKSAAGHPVGYYPKNTPSYMQQQQQQQQQQQHFMGHQVLNHHPTGHSPMLQHSPLVQPQRSPLMAPMQVTAFNQPHHSPIMHPQPSPIMQPQQSPMMQPCHSPMMQPATQPIPHHHQHHHQQQQQVYGAHQPRGTLPPPISIPNTTNYMVSPQPSPAMSYANLGGVSPGGVLPPPAITSPYTQPMQTLPRPLQYTDGTPIQFWARAKYDYAAKDSDEISFKANNLIGVLEADVTQQSWWFGAVFDEYRQTWFNAGSIPSNFMDILQ